MTQCVSRLKIDSLIRMTLRLQTTSDLADAIIATERETNKNRSDGKDSLDENKVVQYLKFRRIRLCNQEKGAPRMVVTERRSPGRTGDYLGSV